MPASKRDAIARKTFYAKHHDLLEACAGIHPASRLSLTAKERELVALVRAEFNYSTRSASMDVLRWTLNAWRKRHELDGDTTKSG